MRTPFLLAGFAMLLLSGACASSSRPAYSATPPSASPPMYGRPAAPAGASVPTNAPPAASTVPAKRLVNTRWVLQMLGAEAVPTTENYATPDLHLTYEADAVEGNAGCNRFRGSYTQAGTDQLTFSQLISTKMACPLLPTETKYMSALGATTRYQIQGDTLRLFGPDAMQPVAWFVAAGQ